MRSTDPLGQDTTHAYDARDNLTAVTDANALVTRYVYDGLDNRSEAHSPNTGTTTFTHDAAGNRLTRTDARGLTTSYRYDALNRLTSIQYPTAALNIRFSYDQGVNGKGRLTGMSDAGGTTRYRYDARGNLSAETRTLLGRPYHFLYGYDAADNPIHLTYPSGRTVTYTRNALGQVTQVQTTQGATQTLASAIAYLPFGPLSSLTFGNGLVMNRSFDRDYRLSEQAAGPAQHLAFTFDDADNLTAITDLIDPARSQGFGYDALDRLTRANGPYGSLGYNYDAVGNRTSELRDATTSTYRYPAASQRLSTIHGGATARFAYDANGNTTSINADTFVYDDTNRLRQATVAGETTTFTYNGRGERVIKAAPGGTTLFHFDPDGRLIAESDAAGATIREYVYLQGQRLALIEAGGTYFLHTDHLDTPQAITDASQRVVWRADYEPFGAVTPEEDPDANEDPLTLNLRFAGQYYDQETGLHYNYFRDYDPSTGRYLQSDPIGLAGGLNTYAYVDANPIRYVDPTGRALCGGLCVGLGLGVLTLLDFLDAADDVKEIAGALTDDCGPRYGDALLSAGLLALGVIDPTPGNIGKRVTKGLGPKAGSAGNDGAKKAFSNKIKDQARAESNNTCVFCGTTTTREPGPTRSEIDHAIPKSRGGNNTLENAQNTCRACNRQKGAKTTDEFLNR